MAHKKKSSFITDLQIQIIIGVTVFAIVVLISYFMMISFNPLDQFKSACIDYGGRYFETANVTCEEHKPYCSNNCELHDKVINLHDLKVIGIPGTTYSKAFCIEDCNYVNAHSTDGMRCVC